MENLKVLKSTYLVVVYVIIKHYFNCHNYINAAML